MIRVIKKNNSSQKMIIVGIFEEICLEEKLCRKLLGNEYSFKQNTETWLAVQWKILDPFIRNLWNQSLLKMPDNWSGWTPLLWSKTSLFIALFLEFSGLQNPWFFLYRLPQKSFHSVVPKEKADKFCFDVVSRPFSIDILKKCLEFWMWSLQRRLSNRFALIQIFFILKKNGDLSSAQINRLCMYNCTPGPWLLRISVVRFSLVLSFKNIQIYLAHANFHWIPSLVLSKRHESNTK